jgi:hypothetical protein
MAMSGLWSSLSSFDVEQLFDTPISRRQIWLGAAAIAAVSGSAYAILSYKPVRNSPSRTAANGLNIENSWLREERLVKPRHSCALSRLLIREKSFRDACDCFLAQAKAAAPTRSPLSRTKTYAVLKDIAARAEKAEVRRIVTRG